MSTNKLWVPWLVAFFLLFAVTISLATVPVVPIPVSGKMYWVDWGTDKIQRANLDGSQVEDLVTSGWGSPTGLALDLGDSRN